MNVCHWSDISPTLGAIEVILGIFVPILGRDKELDVWFDMLFKVSLEWTFVIKRSFVPRWAAIEVILGEFGVWIDKSPVKELFGEAREERRDSFPNSKVSAVSTLKFPEAMFDVKTKVV